MSVASSTVKSRLVALDIQIKEERRRHDAVLNQIAGLADGREVEGTMPTSALLSTLNGERARSARSSRTESVPVKSATQQTPEALPVPKPPAREQQPRPRRVPPPPRGRSPPRKASLPPVARGNSGIRRDAGTYNLVGRRKVSEPELYISKMRHEDRMAQVRKFSLDL
jgi:hypothetical protein